jgi:hypothetical protein
MLPSISHPINVTTRGWEGGVGFFKNVFGGAKKRDTRFSSYISENFDELSQGAEESIPTPDGLGEAGTWIFGAFRDFTYLFKIKSGLDWDHLLPGIQGAAVVHCIKAEGKQRTIDLFQRQIQQLQTVLPRSTPGSRLNGNITPLHVASMAKFNELIVRVADDYVTKHRCPLGLTANALAVLVMVIAEKYFDQITWMSMLMVACNDIAKGKYDHYQQAGSGAHSPPQQQQSEQPSVSKPVPSTGTPEEKEHRVLAHMESSTMEFMNDLRANVNGNLFEMFAGAVFALHQDTLLRYTIDMWLTDDRELNHAWDRMRPSPLGQFPERLGLLIEALFAVANANRANGTAPPRDVSVTPEFAVTLLIATMRSQAAQVWLMTILRGSATARIKPGLEKMWLMLQAVPSEIVAREAVYFSGSYYDNFRTETFYPGRWPQNSTTPWAWHPPAPVTAHRNPDSRYIYLPGLNI